ncbi:GNAT family N-acetyltransferase [Noviherbaspirillum massiliense]|uniref:GNAT family N-acetyltransferase n=1 Tax=Noviherbaspirillum massiliense TaxID=1465823 RepID=UPI00031B2239|nr:GNAT family N-acetyltransferase [Noviherbaspirillum massiliense]
MEFDNMTAGSPLADVSSITLEPRQAGIPGSISITCYEHDVPPFVEAELERLYAHIYSSLVQFRIYGGLNEQTNTYVVHEGEKVVTIFLFRIDGESVEVLNQSIWISNEDILRFARHIFSAYPSIKRIAFHAVRADALQLPYPHQRFNCTDDIVITLPSTAEEYLASLGKNTRRNIKRYMDRLKRSFPSFRYECHVKDEINEQQVREIIGFNRARMAGKNKVSTLDQLEEERIVQLVKACGLFGVATIDGRTCAGGIAYRCGDNYFLYVIAHDPAYDDYWIGILCCYLTICECIARGGKAFHFLWGRYEYKFTLGAVLRQLDRIIIYRSRLQFLLHARMALRIAFNGYMHKLKFGLLEKARRRDSFSARLLSDCFNHGRRLKRFADGLLQRRT